MQNFGVLLAAYGWIIPIVMFALDLMSPSGKEHLGEMMVNFSAQTMPE